MQRGQGPDAAAGAQQQVVQLRTRAVFNLPPEYAVVQAEVRLRGQRHATWVSEPAAVTGGSAVLDFWARMPADVRSLHIRLVGVTPKGYLGCCCKDNAWTPALEAVLHIDPSRSAATAAAGGSADGVTSGSEYVPPRLDEEAGWQAAGGAGGGAGGAAAEWTTVALSLTVATKHMATRMHSWVRRNARRTASMPPLPGTAASATAASASTAAPPLRGRAQQQSDVEMGATASAAAAAASGATGSGLSSGPEGTGARVASAPFVTDGSSLPGSSLGPGVGGGARTGFTGFATDGCSRPSSAPVPGGPRMSSSGPGGPSIPSSGLAEIGVLSVDLARLAVPGAEGGPLLLVEYCVLSLPPEQVRLPELELGANVLHRSMHCYAHGGFMGLAVSLLAEDQLWNDILLKDTAAASQDQGLADKMLGTMRELDLLSMLDAVAAKDYLRFMTTLENSPVLCAYGLTRSGCTTPALPVAAAASPSSPPPSLTLAGPWWDSNRPDIPTQGTALLEATPSLLPPDHQAFTPGTTNGADPPPPPLAATRGGLPLADGGGAGAKDTGGLDADDVHVRLSSSAPQQQQPLALLWQRHSLPPSSLPVYLLQAGFGPGGSGPTGLGLLRAGQPGGQSGGQTSGGSDGQLVNRYGYSPLALEWDLWLDPSDPAGLAGANVDHGSPLHLVQQAITMTLRCNTVAKKLGSHHNRSAGVTPIQWLNSFGTSLNLGAHGERSVPLPLHCCASATGSPVAGADPLALTAYPDGSACPSLESYLQITVQDLAFLVRTDSAVLGSVGSGFGSGTGAAATNGTGSTGGADEDVLRAPGALRCRLRLLGNAMSRPPVDVAVTRAVAKGGCGAAEGAGVGEHRYRADLEEAASGGRKGRGVAVGAEAAGSPPRPSLYPVHHDVSTSLLVVEVYSYNRARLRQRLRQCVLAHAVVPLADILRHAERIASASVTTTEAGGSGQEAAVHLVVRKRMHVTRWGDAAAVGAVERALEEVASGVVEAPDVAETMARGGNAAAGKGAAHAAAPPPRLGKAHSWAHPPGEAGGMGLRELVQALRAEEEGAANGGAGRGLEEGATGEEEEDDDRDELGSLGAMSTAFSAYSEGDVSILDVEDPAHLRFLETAQSTAIGSSAPCAFQLHQPARHPCELRLSLSIRRASVLDAAQQLYGLDKAVAQSCVAMLAAPGGLYLDIKSGYSKAKHLKWFASTLAGIGVNVKAICSFVPSQINFSGLRDTLPFGGHGHAAQAPPAVQAAVQARHSRQYSERDSAGKGDGPPGTRPAGSMMEGAKARAPPLVSVLEPEAPETVGTAGAETPGASASLPQHSTEREISSADAASAGAAEGSPAADAVCSGESSTAAPLPQAAGAVCSCESSTAAPLPKAARAAVAVEAAPLDVEGIHLDPGEHGPGPDESLHAAGASTRTGLGLAAGRRGGPKRLPGPVAGEAEGAPMDVEGVHLDPGEAGPGPDEPSHAAGTRTDLGLAAGRRGDAKRLPGPVAEAREGPGAACMAAGEAQGATGTSSAAAVEPAAAAPGPRLPYDAVLFFHGLNGLELACESGQVAPGTCVLFNGASLLKEDVQAVLEDLRLVPLAGHDEPQADANAAAAFQKASAAAGGATSIPDRVDVEAWRRYCTVIQVFKLYGGIYVQEPDASPASVSALVVLVNANPGAFPLGFAYGHLSNKMVVVAGHEGRGMAAQQLLEELSSRKQLGSKVEKWIQQGVHLGATDEVYISWGRRLLYRPDLLYLKEQHLILQLLADYPSEQGLVSIVQSMGGVRTLFLRFFKHYAATSFFTLFELGFNVNHTKGLMRLLRNRGVLSAMEPAEKVAFMVWLLRGTRGTLAYNLHYCGRADLHKLAKEAFICMAESCMKDELQQAVDEFGGHALVRRRLRGWLSVQGKFYERRLQAVLQHFDQQALRGDPPEPAYKHTRYGYVQYMRPKEEEHEDESSARRAGRRAVGFLSKWVCHSLRNSDSIVEINGQMWTTDPRHTRRKSVGWKLWRLSIKLLVFCYTWLWNLCLWPQLCWMWPLCSFVIVCSPYCHSRVLPLLLAIFLVIAMYLLTAGAATGGAVGTETSDRRMLL